ncbi:MAG: group 1 glutathionylspermidine synthase-like protein [Parcubacteria bacterium C7867-001]|nr:MAG: group 1 glutathionylspermidine synthase-like protein [Parcubacteria bacterium C7867-001]
MKRHSIAPRPDWQQKVQELGMVWHSVRLEDGTELPYWNESAYYQFTADQIDEIERDSEALHQLFLAAGQHVIDENRFGEFGIPEFVVPLIKRAWNEEPPALNHGRFDLAYNGTGRVKLLEYNCDTPTSMFEAAVVQWNWKEEVFPTHDQFTSLHDKLLARWQHIAPQLKSRRVHFTHMNDAAGEDTLTTTYLRDLAVQAGLDTEPVFIQDIGWDKKRKRFVGFQDEPIDVLYHLYPWEWLANEDFGPHIVECYDKMQWIEPIWKMLWSNKAILPVLWELNPGHPNLLPTYFEPRSKDYVKKPKLAREGANITVVRNGEAVEETAGDYGEEGYVYQDLYPIPNFSGNYPIIGSWMVDGWAAGMGIREGNGLVTGNTGRFVPHIFSKR